ncbi:iron uptake transporter permease EfeU [Microbacterium sp. X-17]|uniref:iron uptake transporter permease EfeU n=1 Tax=Microbacterium sp. X-17 TaxID=3144404 RepID=UPI0031F5D1E5
MLANYLIGLREGLEAGLIVGILLAYVNRVGRRDVLLRLWIGIGVAIAIALGLGALLTWGPYGLSVQAQEAIGGILSIVAVGLVTWMIFWMALHARDLRGELHSRLDAALAGTGIGIVVLGVVAVGRESIETALFLWAAAKSETNTALGTIGAVGGILTAVVLAYLVYRGAMRINLRVFFFWTGLFLVLVAAGVFAYGLGDLQEAGLLPGLGQAAYSVSGIISPTSWYGVILSGIFNFTAEPTWLQVIGWVSYLVVVLVLFLRVSGVGRRQPEPSPAPDRVPSPAAR